MPKEILGLPVRVAAIAAAPQFAFAAALVAYVSLLPDWVRAKMPDLSGWWGLAITVAVGLAFFELGRFGRQRAIADLKRMRGVR